MNELKARKYRIAITLTGKAEIEVEANNPIQARNYVRELIEQQTFEMNDLECEWDVRSAPEHNLKGRGNLARFS